LRDIEEVCQGADCEVQPWGCLGRCGKGPNVEVIEKSGARKIKEGVKSFSRMMEVVGDSSRISGVEKETAKLKFSLRREADTAKKDALLAQAFAKLGGNAKVAAAQYPWLYSTLLVLRSSHTMKAQPSNALDDAQQALALSPQWAQSHIACANVLESLGRAKEAAAEVKEAIQIGKGVELRALQRLLTRLERKGMQQQDGPTEAVLATAATPAVPAAVQDKVAKTSKQEKDAVESAGKKPKKERKEKSNAQKAVTQAAPLQATQSAEKIDLEAVPDFMPWVLDEVHSLNHNCLLMRFLLRDRPALCAALAEDLSSIWHIDLKVRLPDGEEVVRSYTPASDSSALSLGCIDLMVKVYPQGKMTQHLASLRPSSSVLVSKPQCTLDPVEFPSGLVMVAGGSAVTVALQVCEAVCKFLHTMPAKQMEPPAQRGVHLVLCNHLTVDVLYARRFTELQVQYPEILQVVHCISRGPVPIGAALGEATWRSGRFRMAALPSKSFNKLPAVVSGPPGLCRSALDALLAFGIPRLRVEVLDPYVMDITENHDQVLKEEIASHAKPIHGSSSREEARASLGAPASQFSAIFNTAWAMASGRLCTRPRAALADEPLEESASECEP